MKNRPLAIISVGLLALFLSHCMAYQLEPPSISLGNGSTSPAQLQMSLDFGATGYYSSDGSYPSVRFDVKNPPLFVDNVSIKAVQSKDGFVTSGVESQSFLVGHVMADSGYRAPDGPPGSWTTVGNGYTLTLSSVTGNGLGTDDNTRVVLAIGYTGSVGTNWSGLELNNDIGLSSPSPNAGSVTLTFGDGTSTLFAQNGPNASGIYEFHISVGTIEFRVLLPYTYLPHWNNTSP